MENMVNPYVSYGEFKQTLDQELQKAAQSFVRIGWLLKVASETNVLEGSGYKSMAEFASAEYHLDASQTSRFMDIYDQYGDPEHCGTLLPQYESYGYAKLSEMLTLPSEVADAIGPEYTRSEIREIKEEVRQEQKISDLEVMMEPQKMPPEGSMDLATMVLHEYFRDPSKAEQYCSIYEQYYSAADKDDLDENVQKIMDILAPEGYAALMARVPGKGKFMLSIRSEKEPVVVVDIRSNEKTEVAWEDFVQDCWNATGEHIEGTPQENWSHEYRQPYPVRKEEKTEHRENTPSSPVKAPEKPKKPVSRVSIAKPQKPKKDNAQVPEQTGEPQLPGQMDIGDYPGVVPDQIPGNMNPPESALITGETDSETLQASQNGNIAQEQTACISKVPCETDSETCKEAVEEETREDEPANPHISQCGEDDPAAGIDKESLLIKIESLKEAVRGSRWKTVMITEAWIHDIVNQIRQEQDRIDEERAVEEEEAEE